MSYFLISKQVIVEHQMLVEAENLVAAQFKALAAENQDKWRELEPEMIWHSQMIQEADGEGEEEEYPEVVR